MTLVGFTSFSYVMHQQYPETFSQGAIFAPIIFGCPFSHLRDFTSPSALQCDTRSDLHLSDPLGNDWRQKLRGKTQAFERNRFWWHIILHFCSEKFLQFPVFTNQSLSRWGCDYHVEICKCLPCWCTHCDIETMISPVLGKVCLQGQVNCIQDLSVLAGDLDV